MGWDVRLFKDNVELSTIKYMLEAFNEEQKTKFRILDIKIVPRYFFKAM